MLIETVPTIANVVKGIGLIYPSSPYTYHVLNTLSINVFEGRSPTNLISIYQELKPVSIPIWSHPTIHTNDFLLNKLNKRLIHVVSYSKISITYTVYYRNSVHVQMNHWESSWTLQQKLGRY